MIKPDERRGGGGGESEVKFQSPGYSRDLCRDVQVTILKKTTTGGVVVSPRHPISGRRQIK